MLVEQDLPDFGKLTFSFEEARFDERERDVVVRRLNRATTFCPRASANISKVVEREKCGEDAPGQK